MKKLCLIVCLLLMIPGMAFAKLSRTHDDFDGTTSITSNVNFRVDPFYLVSFDKGFVPKASPFPIYSLFLLIEDNDEWHFFSKDDAEIKFNNDDNVYNLHIFDANAKQTKYGGLDTNCSIMVPADLINKIQTANSITLRVHFTNHPDVTWKIPNDVLSEWKTVISANEDGTITQNNKQTAN
jgi:hypothetical protein